MTIDDDKSVYVGGLPYDTTEDNVRKAFELYGSVVAVKIINDRGVGGKCYGFVTFTNSRSAVDAINDMNGRTIDRRVVRVNEVRARGGKSNFGRESFRRNPERGTDWHRGRGRERDYDHDKDQYLDRNRERSRDHDQDRERGSDRERDHVRSRDRFIDRDRDRDEDRDMEDTEHEHDRHHEWERERDREMDGGREKEIKRTKDHLKSGDKDKDYTPKKGNGSNLSDRHSRELSSDSSDDNCDKVEEQLNLSKQRLEELQKEIPQIEVLADEKRQIVSKLQEKSQKLEDALTTAKKLSSHRRMQLIKLHKCYEQVKDYNERLKSSEQELQSLVDATMIEVDVGNDASFGTGS
ncbi:uncharacterized protein LOC132277238 isoform X2 [Cornus florida]|uniref:uncharacterized protein LOC132277238 isoform X2 n=1 Tax=Cornus florida TaxID=4283 RepID=UPI00289F2736|nr:uncharacterized protein LOC132277238 isoform X2 [Cornus florida]